AEGAAPARDRGGAAPPRPPRARATTRPARPTPAHGAETDDSGDGAAGGAEALVSAVQSDVWVLAGSSAPARGTGRTGAAGASAPEPGGAASASGVASAGAARAGPRARRAGRR